MDPSFWNERFGAPGYVYGTEPNDFLRAEAHRIPPGRVLCLAEGQGRNAVFLAGLGYQVTALDYSTEGLKKAEQLARDRGVTLELLQADLADYAPPEGRYAGIVAIFAHLPRPIRQPVYGWVARALQPGGLFVLESYSPAQLAFNTGGPKDVTMLPGLAELGQELVGLEQVLGQEVERDVQEGTMHSGLSATVQFIGRRP